MLHFARTAILRAEVERTAVRAAQTTTNWTQTLSLPKSTFPARASDADLDRYREKCADHLYRWQLEHRPKDSNHQFVLHDGPPYANGAVHVGHALNKIVKDMILRWELARGKRVHYRPGWDCHGLPIELKALQEALVEQDSVQQSRAGGTLDHWRRQMPAQEIRARARRLANRTIKSQMKSFKEWGIMGDWATPYKTMDRDFEIRQLAVFRDMADKNLISRDYRPVYWSPSSGTALAEAELEYDDAHVCNAAFVKMPLVRLPPILAQEPKIRRSEIGAVIWTTTPWTLPANKAVAVKADLGYAVVDFCDSTGKSLHGQLIVAKNRLEHISKYVEGVDHVITVIDNLSGAQLAYNGASCYNVFQDSSSPIICAEFVTSSSGSGLVHMAPGHGMEDYQVCRENHIESTFAPVDDQGKFTEDVATQVFSRQLHNLDVQTAGVRAVLDILHGRINCVPAEIWSSNYNLLLATHQLTHKNPIDWRTKEPVIVRATAQWFADVSAVKHEALASLQKVHFIPSNGRERLSAFINGRTQWCISRQRAWGVPIPALFNPCTKEVCISSDSITHIMKVLEQKGTDAWFTDALDDPIWLHESLGKGPWIRGQDTMDVWFDSGTSWTLLDARQGRPVSDVYFEGTDQHRGWFQSSLLTSVSLQSDVDEPRAPYDKLITHGFTLDSQGRKMSKSIGNVISPSEIIGGSLLPALKPKKQKSKAQSVKHSTAQSRPQFDSMGPDMLRLWAASSDYTRDVVIAIPMLQEIQQALQKYRVTFKFLLGVLSDSITNEPEQDLRVSAPTFADQIVLQRLSSTSRAVYDAYENYQFHRGVKEINNFVLKDLSAFYFEICKDRLYTDSQRVRCNTQCVLRIVFDELIQMLLPIVPHLIEEVWQHMPDQAEKKYPFYRIWHKPYETNFQQCDEAEPLLDMMQHFERVSNATKLAQEEARSAGHLRSGLSCEVALHLTYGTPAAFAEQVHRWQDAGELAELLVVSRTEVTGPSNTPPNKEHAWQYEQPVMIGGRLACTVKIVPPSQHKCVRCWRFVAQDAETPCERCQNVLVERGHM